MLLIKKIWLWWIVLNGVVLIIFTSMVNYNSALLFGYLLGMMVTFLSILSIQMSTKIIKSGRRIVVIVTILRLLFIILIMSAAILLTIYINKVSSSNDTLSKQLIEPINLYCLISALFMPFISVILSHIKTKTKEVKWTM